MKKENFLSTAKERMKIGVDYWNDNFKRYRDSLTFLEGTDGHWDSEEKEKRAERDRPCLTFKSVNKYAKKLVGEIRRNKIKIKAKAASSDADYETAKVIEGKLCDIQHKSEAENIYDYVATQMVEGGLGAMRALTRYKDDNPFEQEIYIERIENPTNVIIDPNSKKPNFEDAEWLFITTEISKDQFKRQFPKNNYPTSEMDNFEIWLRDDQVIVTEYYYKEYYDEPWVKLSDGRSMPQEKFEEETDRINEFNNSIQYDMYGRMTAEPLDFPTIEKEKNVKKYKIKWAKLTGNDILDEKDVPGEYIPVAFAIGEMRFIDNQKMIRGLIYDGIDSARMYDYWNTAALEQIILAGKAKRMMTPKQVAGFEKQFADDDNVPYHLYNIDPAAVNPPPLEQPQQPPMAILSQITQAEENIKSSIGMYDTDLGDQGRELSGAAITARQMPSQVSNFIYHDNLAKVVAYIGKIIYSMIPEIYDTERIEKIRGEDDSENFAPINTTAGNALQMMNEAPEKFATLDKNKLQKQIMERGENSDYNKLSQGKYDIYISVGPAYETQRQEASQRFLDLMQLAMGAQSPVALVNLYYAVKTMDIDGADEYADAIRKMIPYGMLPPKPGEQPPPPPRPSLEQEIQKEVLMLERRNQEAKAKVEEQRLKTEAIKQERLMLEAQIELQKAGLEKETTVMKTMSQIRKDQQQSGQGVY